MSADAPPAPTAGRRVRGFGSYETYIVVLAPLLNSMSGIGIDLYAPSLPAIGQELGASAALMQNTLTVTLLAFAIGQIFFGVVADSVGRLHALWPGLALFVAASVLAMLATNIETLLLARALQGFAMGACQVVARALLVDNLRGERFYNAVVYLSLAWGLSPVLAPFIGSHVEALAGWRWNFFVYAAYSALLLALSLQLRESLPAAARKRPAAALRSLGGIAADRRFQHAALVMGSSFAIFLMWNVVGPYIVQQRLGGSVTDFGGTALAAGLAFLAGTLLNRALIRRCPAHRVMWAGIAAFALGVLVLAATPGRLYLPGIVAGVMLADFGQGLIFSNAVAKTMPLFPDRAGATASLLGCANMACGALAAWAISLLQITANAQLAAVFALLLALQALAIAGLLASTRAAAPTPA